VLSVRELINSWVVTAASSHVSVDHVLDVDGDHGAVLHEHVVETAAGLGVGPLIGKVETGFLDVGAGQGHTCWHDGCRDVHLHAFGRHQLEAAAHAVGVNSEEEQVSEALVKVASADGLYVESVVPGGELSVARGEVSVHDLVGVEWTAVAGSDTPVHAARRGSADKLVGKSELAGGHITDSADHAGADRDGERCLSDGGEVVDVTSVSDPQDVGASRDHRRAHDVDVVGEVVLFRVTAAAEGVVSVADVHGVHVDTRVGDCVEQLAVRLVVSELVVHVEALWIDRRRRDVQGGEDGLCRHGERKALRGSKDESGSLGVECNPQVVDLSGLEVSSDLNVVGEIVFLGAGSAEESPVSGVDILGGDSKWAARVGDNVVQRTSTVRVGELVVNVEPSEGDAVSSDFHGADSRDNDNVGLCQNQVSTIAIGVSCHPQEVGLSFLKADRNLHGVFKVVLLHLAAGGQSLGSQTDVVSSVVLNARLGQSVVHFSSTNVSCKLIGESEPLRGCFSRFNTDGDFSSLHAKTDTRSSCKLKSLAVSVKVKCHPNFVLNVWL